MKKRCSSVVWLLLALVMLVFSFAGCAKQTSADDKVIKFAAANLKVYEDTTKVLAAEVEKLGYTLEYQFLSDNTQLNEAVENGEVFANYHQHVAYLNEFNASHGTHLAIAFKVFTDRAGLFSLKYHSLDELPDGAVISIPVDVGNNFRTFIILADAGLITLKEGVEPTDVTQADIVDNPHNFTFTEVDYTMLSRAIEDADAGFLYATVAAEIGLDFGEDALLSEREDLQSPDVIAVREENVGSEKAKILQQAYQSDAMKKALLDAYDGVEVLLPAW
jgi:ABC-type metal ion transport system, periplasmic component/surface antigen